MIKGYDLMIVFNWSKYTKRLFLNKNKDMRLITALFLVILTFSCKSSKTVPPVTMYQDVAVLAHDSLMGRQVGTEYEKKSASYLEKRFKNLHLTPQGTNGYYQDFTFSRSSNPHQSPEYVGQNERVATDREHVTGRNVIGFLNNNAPHTVVIGAHYDHLGMGGINSLYRGEPDIHNGADDNASGVAMMLYLAKELNKKEAPKNNNYLFIAFSGEEEGLLGSNYFVKNPTIDLKKVTYMFNMDMVGRLNEEKTLAVYGVGTAPNLSEVVQANKKDLHIVEKESGVGPSDHTSFYLSDIPVLHFFTGQHEDYHRPSDDTEKVNFEGMQLVADYIYSLISDLDKEEKLVFQKTKNESESTPDFKVTLGVVPDYLYDKEGMRIDGVSEDKPAQHAGMQKGDVVKKMGEYVISDMMSYMESLSKFEKGETIIVTIERNGEEQEVEVTF